MFIYYVHYLVRRELLGLSYLVHIWNGIGPSLLLKHLKKIRKEFVSMKIVFTSWCWINGKKVYKWMKTASSSSSNIFPLYSQMKGCCFSSCEKFPPSFPLISYYVLNYRHRSYWHISFHSRLNDWNVFPSTSFFKSLDIHSIKKNFIDLIDNT